MMELILSYCVYRWILAAGLAADQTGVCLAVGNSLTNPASPLLHVKLLCVTPPWYGEQGGGVD